MELSRQDHGGTLVVTVNEPRIDSAVAIRFKDRMRQLTEEGPERVVLDLSQVDFIDSSGLGAIVGAMKQMGADRRLDLSGLRENVAKVFMLTRMDKVFRIHVDLDDALIG